ncbi:unnamed protein product, partial [marine sediment metagenome]
GRSIIVESDMHKEVTDEQILKFRPLVKNIAYKFKNSGEPLEDLEQLGIFISWCLSLI